MTSVDLEDLELWFICPWCRSDAPEPAVADPTNVTVDHIGGDTAFGVRCRNCGAVVNWRVTEDGIECISAD